MPPRYRKCWRVRVGRHGELLAYGLVMTDLHTFCGHRLGQGRARPVVAVAALLVAALLGAGTVATGPAGAVAVPGWAPPVAPPPGSAAIVVAVVAAERQITSLRTYSDAQAYLEVAKGDAAAADRAYGRSLRELGVAKGQEVRALAAKAVAKATVNLYDQALCELGVAEYTGIAETDNLDLASQEREVEQAELGDVAATDTAAGFEKAKTELARSIRLANVARAALAVAKTVAVHNRALLGTARAQYHLRQSCVFLNMYPLNLPEVMVPFAQEKIDDKGRLTDATTREKISDLVGALIIWARRLK